MSSRSETDDLLKEAKVATAESNSEERKSHDVNEDDVAALLKQLGDDKEEKLINARSESHETTHDSSQKQHRVEDDSTEVAAILSQLTDEARLEQKFEESDSESPFPSVSKLSLPSAPNETDSTEDELSSRLANLRSFPVKNYTGIDRGSINVFVPGIAKMDNDETIHWCGNSNSPLN